MIKEKVFICDCHTPEHQFVVSYFPDDPEDPLVYVQPRLNHYLGFWKRLCKGLGYIFMAKEASYDEVILNKEQMTELRDLLNEKLDELD